jgi:hypothetical protein
VVVVLVAAAVVLVVLVAVLLQEVTAVLVQLPALHGWKRSARSSRGTSAWQENSPT